MTTKVTLSDPLTLEDRVRVVFAMLVDIQKDVYTGRYSEPGRFNITTLQHVMFDDDETLRSYRQEMQAVIERNDADGSIDGPIVRRLAQLPRQAR